MRQITVLQRGGGGGTSSIAGLLSILGIPKVGATLTVYTHLLGGEPSDYQYQWKEWTPTGTSPIGNNITNGTGNTYTLNSLEIGKYILVEVTYNGETISSGIVGPVSSAGSVFISGTDQVGETFFADTHLLDTDPSSYEWQSYSSANGWTAIPGATASDYVLTASDEGTYIRLKVSIENDSIAIISGTRGPIRPADPSVTPTNPSNGIGALTLGEEGNITSADLVFSPQNSLYVAGELLTVTLADYLLDNPDTTPENEAVFSDYHWFLDDTDFSDQDGDGTFDTTSFQIYIDDLADGNHTVSFYGRRTVNGNNYYYSAVKSFRVRK